METQELLCKLKCQHEKFANEIILKLKYCFRLHEDEPYPKEFLFASSKMCDAIIAISYLLRYYYRGVYYYLYDELTDLKEFEKFCFSLPVLRSKRFSFYFLLRISFVFEITMYLFKAGYDYFHIARKCFAAFPDLLYFHAVGGWARLHNISAYILHVTKVSKKKIVAEHPLVGNFIEERSGFYDPVFSCYFYDPILLMDRKDVPTFNEEFFNPKDKRALKTIHNHFIASPKPKFKYRAKDLIKFNEIFPLKNRVLFQIENESNISSYIIYKLYAEIQQIHTFFRTFMDAETLKMYSPPKSNSENTEENFRFECFGYYSIKISQPEIEAEFCKLDHHKSSFPHAFYEENLRIFQHMKNAVMKDIFEFYSSKVEKNRKNIESSLSGSDEFDDSELCTTEEECDPLSMEMLPNPKYKLIYGNTENAETMKGDTKLLNEGDSKISQSTSNTSDMKIHEENIESICKNVSALKLDDDFEINLTEEECKQLSDEIMEGGTESLNEVEAKMSQFASSTSHMGIADAFDDIDLYTTEEECEPLSNEIFPTPDYRLIHGDMENTEIMKGSTKSLNEGDSKISQVTSSTSDMKIHKNIESISEDITEEYTDVDLLTTIHECEELSKELFATTEYMLIHGDTENTEIMKRGTKSLNEGDSEISQSTSSTSDMKFKKKVESICQEITEEYKNMDFRTTMQECEEWSNRFFPTPESRLIHYATESLEILEKGTKSLNEGDSKISQSTSSILSSNEELSEIQQSVSKGILEKGTKSINEGDSKISQSTSSILSSNEELREILQSVSKGSTHSSNEEISKTPQSEYKNMDFRTTMQECEEWSNIFFSTPESRLIHYATESLEMLEKDSKSLNEGDSKISQSTSSILSSNEEISEILRSVSKGFLEKGTKSLNEGDSKISQSTSSILSSNEELSEILQSVSKGSTHSSNEEISKTPQSTLAISELPKDKKLELIQLLMDITRLSKENKEILTNALPTNPIMQCFDQLKEKKSERGLSSVLENMSFVSKATKQLFFRILGECSEFSTEERNELCRLLVRIPEDMASGKTNVYKIINNMSFCTDQEKSDLITSIMDFTKEELEELQITEITDDKLSSTDDMKIVDVFEGIFNNDDDDICEEFRQFVMLCQNEGEVNLDKLQELAAPSVKAGFPKKVNEKKLESKQPSRAKPIPEQLSQENDDSEDDDHTICRCFEKGRLAAAAASRLTSSNKSVDEHSKNLDVANSSGNRRRRKANKKSKKRSKK